MAQARINFLPFASINHAAYQRSYRLPVASFLAQAQTRDRGLGY